MKNLFERISNVFAMISKASYAAHLARNHQYNRAKAIMEK